MGYTTDFRNQFILDKPLTLGQAEKINNFAGTRHDDLVDEEGRKYPGIWCQWTVGGEEELSDDNLDIIAWDGGEKFYNYVEWLQYIIDRFLVPWGYVMNGEVDYRGEDWDDIGTIKVKDNKITIK